MYCETVLRLCGIRPPALRYGASSYISMGMLAFYGSSSIWCLSIFTSALLTRGIPMYFKGGWMLINRLHPKMLCLFTHALRLMGILLSGWGMWQFCEQASRCCVQFASTLLLEGIPQNGRVRMLRTWKEHHSVPAIAPTLSIMGILPYMVRGCARWLFGNILSIDVENISPFLTV